MLLAERDTPEKQQAYYEARRICDRHDIRDDEGFEQMLMTVRHQSFMRAIEPLQDIKVRAMTLQLPHFYVVLGEDGKMRHMEKAPLPPAMQELFRRVDDMIIEQAQRWGLDMCPLEHQKGKP